MVAQRMAQRMISMLRNKTLVTVWTALIAHRQRGTAPQTTSRKFKAALEEHHNTVASGLDRILQGGETSS